MTSAADDETEVKWRSPLAVWAKSQCLDAKNWFKFGSRVPEYDGYSWPFGLPIDRTAMEDTSLYLTMIDGRFDDNVRCAWQLPWYYSRLPIRTPPRRADANFVIENIGHWHREPAVYERLRRLIAERHIDHPYTVEKKLYAITPFCLIVQHWFERFGVRQIDIAATQIIMFYTFETFIQECLASEARKKGIAVAQIVAAYEHIYTNARPPDAFPDDPAQFQLAKLVKRQPVWENLRTTSKTSQIPDRVWGPQRIINSYREALFFLRLQAHLSVALAAACYGLPALNANASPSALVRVVSQAPSIDELAPTWLRHVLGFHDYAGECENLLIALARRYGTELSPGPGGLLIPAYIKPRSEAEKAIARTSPPLRKGRPGADPLAFERYRWSLFEPSLDDHSITAWTENFTREAS